MPTMVKAPELVSPVVSHESAIDRPVEQSGLSRFMQDVLPAAMKGYDEYKKENADRLTALGQMDELNGVQREVSFFDEDAYTQGKEFQKLNSTQLAEDQDFTTKVASMAEEGKSKDEIWAVGQEYMRKSVDATYYSELSPALKEKMYQADLKRNIVNQKVVTDAMTAATQKRFAFDRNNRVLSLYNDLSTATSPDQYDVLISAYKDKGEIAYTTPSLGNLSPDDAVKAVEQDLSSVVEFWTTQMKDPTTANATKAANLQNFIDYAVANKHIPMGTAMKLQGTISGIQSNIMAANDIQAKASLAQDKYTWDTQPDSFDINDIQGKVVAVQGQVNRKEITAETGLSIIQGYLGYGADRQQKIFNAKEDMTPEDMIKADYTMLQWRSQGHSEDSYINNYEQYIASLYPDSTTAGMAMFNQAMTGDPSGFTLNKLATKGGTWLAGNVLSTIRLSEADLAKDPNGKARIAQFQLLGQQYRQINSTRPDVADAFLDGFPEGTRGIVRNALARGASVSDLRQDMANAPKLTEQHKWANDAVKALKYDNLKAGFFGRLMGQNPSGVMTAFGSQQQAVNDYQASLVRNAVSNDLDIFSRDLTGGTPEELARAISSKHLLIPSKQWDYSAVIIPPRAQTALAARYASKGLGSATNEYVVSAIDTRREEIHKVVGGEAENILVDVDRLGNRVNFHILGDDGRVNPKYPRGESMNLVELDKRVNKVLADQGIVSKQPARKVGFSLLQDKSAFLRPAAPVGKVAVTIKGSGKQTMVQYNNTAAIPFGGNINLTGILLNHWAKREGFTVNMGTKSGTPAGGGQKSVNIMGLGANMNVHANASDGRGSTWYKRYAAAQGNPQAVMDVDSDFIAHHHKQLPELLRKANIPVPTTAPYNPNNIPALTAIADAMWLSPKTGAYMANVLKQPTREMAITKLKQNKALWTTQENGQIHPRSQDFANMVNAYYNTR